VAGNPTDTVITGAADLLGSSLEQIGALASLEGMVYLHEANSFDLDFVEKCPVAVARPRRADFSSGRPSRCTRQCCEEGAQIVAKDEGALPTFAGFEISVCDGLIDFCPANPRHGASFRNRKTFALKI
jgi:hypothetical protein